AGPPPLAEALGESAEKAIEQTGFDPDTGQVIDRARFDEWQRRTTAASPPTDVPAQVKLLELFRNASLALQTWVDDESRRDLILRGNLKDILEEPALAGILKRFAGEGREFQEKLLDHLVFLAKNRRQHYLARAK